MNGWTCKSSCTPRKRNSRAKRWSACGLKRPRKRRNRHRHRRPHGRNRKRPMTIFHSDVLLDPETGELLEPPPGATFVLKIQEEARSTTIAHLWVRWRLTFYPDWCAITYNGHLVNLAQACLEERRPVQIECIRNKHYGPEVVKLSPLWKDGEQEPF